MFSFILKVSYFVTFMLYNYFIKRNEELSLKTLLINAHPDFNNLNHFSNQLQELFLANYKSQFSEDDLTIFNLYDLDGNLPRIEQNQLLKIWDKKAAGEKLSADELNIAQTSERLLKEFKEHHRLVIVTPLHNFNITSRLKDYIDNILIARETFKYLDSPDEKGKVSTGLMTDDYRALLLFASGSVYSENNFYQDLDFAPQYLKMIFSEIMGFDTFEIVRAEDTATLAKNEILDKAKENLDKALKNFY